MPLMPLIARSTAATDYDLSEVVLCPEGRVLWWNTWEAQQRQKAHLVGPNTSEQTDLDEHAMDRQWPDDMR
ncbi:hypothetical protein CBW24_08575 [Pacificitalea manganoxidans]|uniref:Uncharacterized protein n=1 Tax=Pacificitalea manganoxidans TaxID=1411902 RepID=A0A291M008_9RHOB|nr:hypothetical protein CBW24_08575 [Pacificitalea manganoxidans]